MIYYNKDQQKVIGFLILLLFFIAVIKLLPYFHSPYYQEMPHSIHPDLNNHYLEITGEIKKPGVYGFPKRPLLREALAKAGGLRKNLILTETLNDVVLKEGARIKIKQKPGNIASISIGRMDPAKLITLKVPLNINDLSREDLKAIPGIGESLAQKIVEYRKKNGRFTKLETLKKINGIGDKKFETMKRYLSPL